MVDERSEIEMPPLEQPATEMPEQPAGETPFEQPAAQEPKVEEAQAKNNDIEDNMRNMRLAREKAERERDELAARMREIELAQQKPVPPQEEQDFEVGDDDFVEGKHLSAALKKVKRLEEIAVKAEKERHRQINEQKIHNELVSKFSDFNEVVTDKTVKLLREMDPVLAQALHENPDLKSRAVSVYSFIKQNSLHQQDKFVADKNRAQTNAAKPRPLTSVKPQQGESPLSMANAFANGLTPELKKMLNKEMNDYSR